MCGEGGEEDFKNRPGGYIYILKLENVQWGAAIPQIGTRSSDLEETDLRVFRHKIVLHVKSVMLCFHKIR